MAKAMVMLTDAAVVVKFNIKTDYAASERDNLSVRVSYSYAETIGATAVPGPGNGNTSLGAGSMGVSGAGLTHGMTGHGERITPSASGVGSGAGFSVSRGRPGNSLPQWLRCEDACCHEHARARRASSTVRHQLGRVTAILNYPPRQRRGRRWRVSNVRPHCQEAARIRQARQAKEGQQQLRPEPRAPETNAETRRAFLRKAAVSTVAVAAASPTYATREQVPADVLDKEKAIYRAQMENSGKPANVLEKIIEGKLGSYYKQTVLTDQDSIRDTTGKTSVKDVLAAANKTLGASVSVTRFARLKVGEAPQ
jgi:hypothetical protein